MMPEVLNRWLRNRAGWIAVLVAAHAVIMIGDVLDRQLRLGHASLALRDIDIAIDVPLLLGLALLYTSLLLRRRKRSAWTLSVALYLFLLGLNTNALLQVLRTDALGARTALLLLPGVMLGLLWFARNEFVVRSDMRTFATSVKTGALVLGVAFLYGTLGFLLIDHRDFHQNISLLGAMHYTIDQFRLTTPPLHAYTHRAALFQGSLAFMSISAVGFVFVSLFQPLRARYVQQKDYAERARQLIYAEASDSEDYFKLWPQDKTYFFNAKNTAGIAYKVQQGIALSVGAPFGAASATGSALSQFEELCFVNDWSPAFVHVTANWRKRLAERGYGLQLIGQEAVVDVASFMNSTAKQKYFRQIQNRFQKLDFTVEMLEPPHHAAVVDRLAAISDEWLKRPGRTERRLMMGYFSEPYIQQCRIFVARDAAGTIQAFLNLVPSPVAAEADFDMLRSSERAPGNINDYLLTQLIARLTAEGVAQRLNLGLCPLAGIDDKPNTLVNRTLRFVYANGDRLYSFKGLYAFKAKYQPEWRARYIAYKNGAAGFARVMRALTAAMRV